MPQNTPRGYTYPCYSDPTAFPTQMQDLAQDIDLDVQGIIDNIDDARNDPPGARASASANLAIAAGGTTTLTFTTEEYDNAAMFTPGGSVFTATVEGLYLVSYRALFTGGGTGDRSLLIQFTAPATTRAIQTRQKTVTTNIAVNVHALVYMAVGNTVSCQAASDTANTITIRTASITRTTGTTIL